MKSCIKYLFLMPALMATLGLMSDCRVMAQTNENGPLAHLAQVTFDTGLDVAYSANICTALGVTQPGTPFPVKQRTIDTTENPKLSGLAAKHFMVSRVRGHIDIIIAHRTATEGEFYLTTVQGDLEQAVHAQKGIMPQRIPITDVVKADFEKEKAWWLAQPDPPKVASKP